MTPEEREFWASLTIEGREQVGAEWANRVIERYIETAGNDETIERLLIEAQKSIDYKTANEYAVRVGELMGAAFKDEMPSLEAVSPETAQRLLHDTLSALHSSVDSMARRIQTNMNTAAGLGLAPVQTALDTNRIDGLARILSRNGNNAEVWETLADPVVNYSQAIVDRSVRDNARANTKAGLKAFIVRITGAEETREAPLRIKRGNKVYSYIRKYKVPCKWCGNLAGVYEYEDVKGRGNDVFRRHEKCRCTVTYRQGVRAVDVWNKNEWTQANVIQQATKVQNAQAAIQPPPIPDNDLSRQLGEANYKALEKSIPQNAPESVRQLWAKYEDDIQVADMHYKGTAHANRQGVFFDIAKVSNPVNGYDKPWQTLRHECGHYFDTLAAYEVNYPYHYSSWYRNGLFPDTIKKEVQNWVKKKGDIIKPLVAAGDLDALVNMGAITGGDRYAIQQGWYELKYSKNMAYRAFQTEIRNLGNYEMADLSDILQGATNEKLQCGFGHRTNYWKDRTYNGIPDGLATEAFAEFTDSALANPESWATLNKYLPESAKVYLEMVEEMARLK